MNKTYIVYGILAVLLLVLMFSNTAVTMLFGLPMSPITVQCPRDVNKTEYRQAQLCPYTTFGGADAHVWVDVYSSPTCVDCWRFLETENQLRQKYPQIHIRKHDARLCMPDAAVLPVSVVQWHTYDVTHRGLSSLEDLSHTIEQFI